MSRVLKQRERHHRFLARNDGTTQELLLVSGGKRAYLWAGRRDGEVFTFSGAATLRKLAYAILAEVGE